LIEKRSEKLPAYILDAAGLFRINLIDSKIMFTTNEALNEIEDENERLIVGTYLKSSRLKVIEPGEDMKKLALKIAGSNPDLTAADISIIALALMLREKYDITIITDDYELQNVLALNKIRFRGIKTAGINKVIKWTYRCTGCGRQFEKPIKTCPYCGSRVKRKPERILP